MAYRCAFHVTILKIEIFGPLLSGHHKTNQSHLSVPSQLIRRHYSGLHHPWHLSSHCMCYGYSHSLVIFPVLLHMTMSSTICDLICPLSLVHDMPYSFIGHAIAFNCHNFQISHDLFFRVLAPPGGGSSDIFGTASANPEPLKTGRACYGNSRNQSTLVMGDDSTPQPKETATPPRKPRQDDLSGEKIFGAPDKMPAPPPRKDESIFSPPKDQPKPLKSQGLYSTVGGDILIILMAWLISSWSY